MPQRSHPRSMKIKIQNPGGLHLYRHGRFHDTVFTACIWNDDYEITRPRERDQRAQAGRITPHTSSNPERTKAGEGSCRRLCQFNQRVPRGTGSGRTTWKRS